MTYKWLYLALILSGVIILRKGHTFLREKRFSDYLQKFNKSYSHKEFKMRMHMFEESLKVIDVLNSKEPITGARFGLTKFSDWTPEEKLMAHGRQTNMLTEHECISCTATCGYKAETLRAVTKKPVNGVLDWRDEGIIGPIQNQKMCNGCWAFAIVGVMEAMAAMYRPLQQLSVQELIDCSDVTEKCLRGDVKLALEYLCGDFREHSTIFNITTEDNYPPILVNQNCQKHPAEGVGLKEYKIHCKVTDDQIINMLGHGPVIAQVNAEPLFYYTDGIISQHCPDLNSNKFYHVVQIVGYSTNSEDGEIPHYIIKNSYGSDWGEHGYVRIAILRDKNLCGIRTSLATLDVHN